MKRHFVLPLTLRLVGSGAFRARAMPLVPRGFGSAEDQPLLDASAAGAPWRPSLNASLCSSPASSQAGAHEPDFVDLASDELWICRACGSRDYEWSDERKLWRCGSCGSNLLSPQPSMATDPAAGMNGRWCFVPSGPWNFEPNPTFAPGSTPTMSWGILRGPMPQPVRAHLGPCRVSHGPERVHPHVAHGLDSSLPHGPLDGNLLNREETHLEHLTPVLTDLGTALKRKGLRSKCDPKRLGCT